ncbi:hypothetical protein BDV59DRAFT_187893 [Aspergillus ambiguus]|uniref:FHA domain protein n=1 Tax=Aspergillus ambiguus TaxID=176160 RepID=UPI003CCD566A
MMPGKKVIVTLYPLDETLPRTLIFGSDTDSVEIGRSSKRESKNLPPQSDNALFDSRVMSRKHAKMWPCMDRKTIYVQDGGSMHGTFINGNRLPVDENMAISNGDIIAFGAEVVRGRDSYPPVKVRCEYDWIESSEKPPQEEIDEHAHPTNTFCVPDDDESEIEVLDGPIARSNSELSISESGSSSDSEDMSVVEIPSPSTSPLKHQLTGTRHRPIDVDSEQERQPLATPRTTPPLAALMRESTDYIHHIQSGTHDADDPTDEPIDHSWSPQSPEKESLSQDPGETEVNPAEDGSEAGSYEPSVCYSDDSNSMVADEEPDPEYIESAQNDASFSINIPRPVQPKPNVDQCSIHLPPSSTLLNHSLNEFRPDAFTPALPGWSLRGALNDRLNGCRVPLETSMNDCGYPLDPTRSMSNLQSSAGESIPSQSKKSHRDGAFIAMSDICPHPADAWKPSLKRKADEIIQEDKRNPLPAHESPGNEFVPADTYPSGDEQEDTCLPDAQPQVTVEVFSRSNSQISDLCTEKGSQTAQHKLSAAVNERPAKRIRTSGPSTFRTHVTTAAVGAVVGAVGTIALLASLPQDYFL